MTLVAILLALGGAVGLAIGSQRQGSAVKASTGGLDLGSKGFTRLLRNPRWLLGLFLLVAGMAMNAVALAIAPLTVVQPIGAIALVITTFVNAKDQGIRLNRMTIVSVILCVVGSAGFVLLAVTATRGKEATSVQQELTIVVLVAIVVALFGFLAFTFKRRMSAFIYIVGAGVLFGMVAVMTKIIASHLLDPNGRTFLNIPIYSVLAIAAAGALGAWFVQSAYALGPPDLVIAGLTGIDPMVGIAVGIIILNELRPDVAPVSAIGMVAMGIVAIVGVIMLSRHHPDVLERKRKARKRA